MKIESRRGTTGCGKRLDVANQLEDAPIASAKVDSVAVESSAIPQVEQDDTMDYFAKLAG